LPKAHTVRAGECLSSIADLYGLFPDTIWNDPANSHVKQQRKNPNILLAGDQLIIPDKRLKEASGSTDTRHRFRKKGVPAVLRLQVFEGETFRANQEYRLWIDGSTILTGSTDAMGVIEHSIPPRARKAVLIIGPDQYRYELELGAMDPLSEVSGIKARLNNLGYFCGDGQGWDARSQQAMRAFQQRFGLAQTGIPDEQTCQTLEDMHDSISEFPPQPEDDAESQEEEDL
jgi:hypothetical protein